MRGRMPMPTEASVAGADTDTEKPAVQVRVATAPLLNCFMPSSQHLITSPTPASSASPPCCHVHTADAREGDTMMQKRAEHGLVPAAMLQSTLPLTNGENKRRAPLL